MQRYVLDTVALVRILEGRASEKVKEIYDDAKQGNAELIIPTVVLAEIVWILRKRGEHDVIPLILEDIKKQKNSLIIPFSMEIVEEMAKLEESHEMHDEIIALTAFVYGVGNVCTNDDDLVEIKDLGKVW